MKSSADVLDVAIVGGGPAGLSAALTLGRCLRRVVLCDDGHPRNEAANLFNGYLTRDASNPAEFLRIGRQELTRYKTVALQKGMVTNAARGENCFSLTLDSGERITARTLLLATGVRDELPAIEGLRRFYGKAIHTCPFCHGWECRGKPLGVLGGDQAAADLAIELLQWSKIVMLCTNGALQCDEKARSQMKRGGIPVVEKEIKELKGHGDELEGVVFQDGTLLPRSALFFSPRQIQQSRLAEQLGCSFAEDGSIKCGDGTETCVPGLYAAGNTSRGVQLVIVAAAEGARAAVAINSRLVEADFS